MEEVFGDGDKSYEDDIASGPDISPIPQLQISAARVSARPCCA